MVELKDLIYIKKQFDILKFIGNGSTDKSITNTCVSTNTNLSYGQKLIKNLVNHKILIVRKKDLRTNELTLTNKGRMILEQLKIIEIILRD